MVVLGVLIFVPVMSDGFAYKMSDSAGAGIEGNDDLSKDTSAARSVNKLRLCTYMFHVFVFLQLFNLINCRKDGAKDFNVFGKIGHNFFFLAVLGGEFAFQFLFPAAVIRTVGMTQREWGACLMLGATPLLISVLLKCTPERWLTKLEGGPCGIVDESKAVDTGLTRGFDRLAGMEVGAPENEKGDGYEKVDTAA
jgi:hypothetical protein